MPNHAPASSRPAATLLLAALVCGTGRMASAAPGPYADYLYVSAFPHDPAQVQAIWRAAEYVLSPHDPQVGTHELALTGPTLAALRARGIDLQVEPLDVQALVDESYRRQHATPVATSAMFGSFFSTVRPLDAIDSYLNELVQSSQGRATLMTIGKSIQGRDIKAVRISTAPAGVERPSIFISATQHAREWAVPMVAMGLIDALVRQYDADPQVRSVLEALDIYVTPVVNPDGYVASHAGARLQRKNMNPKCNVDLNRNWDAWWGKGTPVNGCAEETYPGLAVFSEPETQAVRDFAQARKDVRLCYDYHSAAQQVGYPFAYTTMKPPDLATDKAWAELYSKTLATIHGTKMPAVSDYGIGAGEGGSAIDYYRLKYPHSIEIELRDGGSLSGFGISDNLVIEFVEENWAAWLAVAVEVAKQTSLGAGAPDAAVTAADAGNERDGKRMATEDSNSPGAADVAVSVRTEAGADRANARDSGEHATEDAGDDPDPGEHPRDSNGANGCDCSAAGGDSRRAGHLWMLVVAVVAVGVARARRRRAGDQSEARQVGQR